MTQPHLTIIAPASIEARSAAQEGLAGGASALQNAGLLDQLKAIGVSVDQIVTPKPVDTSDIIVALGTFNAQIAAAVREARQTQSFPLLTGGTCSHLPGMISGLQQSLPPHSTLGLLWLDAHGDFNTPRTTPSGMLGGMPVATVAGLCHAAWREGSGMTAPLPTNRIMMVDVRNLDPEEEQLIRATDVQIVRQQESDALERIATFAASVDALYVHIDADILDSSLQPNHPTAEPDGLDVQQTLSIVQAAVAHGNLVAFAVVSVNPDGPDGEISLKSGLALLTGCVQAWVSHAETV